MIYRGFLFHFKGSFFVVLSNSFIVISFTCLIVHSFKAYISVVSGLFRELCNQHHSQFENICFTPRKKLWSQSPLPAFLPALQPAPGNLSSASVYSFVFSGCLV